MNFNDLNDFDSEGLPYNISFVADEDDVTVQLITHDDEGSEQIDIYHVLTVSGYSSSIENDNDIEIYNEDQLLIGLICFSTSDKSFDISDLTPARYISYLVDRSGSLTTGFSGNYIFRKSYVLILDEFINIYREKYQVLSPHWGKFTHECSEKVTIDFPDKLVVTSELIMPTREHVTKFQRAILSTDGFDRFLKKYHLLELIYDYVCVLRLRTMSTDLNGFSDVMKDYSNSKELNRLNDMVKNYVRNSDEISRVFVVSKDFKSVVISLCQDIDRGDNPLRESGKWNAFWAFVEAENISFTEDKITSSSPKFAKYSNADEYNAHLFKIAAFWIYRIRCSIAHMKIGEFIFQEDDEEFVVKVGERLIDSFIECIYTNQTFKALVGKSDKMDALLQTI